MFVQLRSEEFLKVITLNLKMETYSIQIQVFISPKEGSSQHSFNMTIILEDISRCGKKNKSFKKKLIMHASNSGRKYIYLT